MSAKTFNYDIITLIELVKSRDCLWDKFSDDYKDRIVKRNAWKEVFESLEPDFNSMDDNEQQKIGDIIMTKWNNTRDSFVRSLKTKNGKLKRRYLYHKYLQFLLKNKQMDSTISSITLDPPSCDDTEHRNKQIDSTISNITLDPPSCDDTEHSDASTSNTLSTCSEVSQKKRRKLLSQKEETPAQLDEDEAFFFSILPTVRNMTEDDKLDFRMDVMWLLKKYRNCYRKDTENSFQMTR